jgi:hypothetical protein
MVHSRAFLEKKFDQLYARATVALQEHDPCQVRNGACFSMREYPENHVNEPFCCTGCKHLKPDGCSVESLFCKLWVCAPIDNVNKQRRRGKMAYSPLFKELAAIRLQARKYDFLIWRGTKEESLDKAEKSRKSAA